MFAIDLEGNISKTLKKLSKVLEKQSASPALPKQSEALAALTANH